MSVYRRFISYMYDHLQSSKGKNCGFVKIEIKNSKCTFSFQLKHAPCQETCNVYLYCPSEASPFLYAGSIPIQKGNAVQKLVLDSVHMTDRILPFSKCAGLLCTDEQGHHCSTCWKNDVTIPEYSPEQTTDTSAEPETRSSQDTVPSKKEPSVQENPSSEVNSSGHKDLAVPKDASEPTLFETKTNITNQNIPCKKKTFSQLWQHLQTELPPLDPFEDHAIVETIKITPSDLGYLQACNLDLGTNQFLLHGYKNYHHLILGRIHGQMQYIIGIPGIYDPQEQFMAKMFGFPCFKPIRECRQKNGQFGYWLRCFR